MRPDLPIDLVLVRHGESEGNVASNASKVGDDSYYTDAFRARHSRLWRLTDRGIEQARSAGEWIRAEIGPEFDALYVSDYLRAKETAALLDVSSAAGWQVEIYLRERDYGMLDVLTRSERDEFYGRELTARERSAFYWSPPDGESLAQVCLRADRVLTTLASEASNSLALLVLHGELLWAFRVRLERMTVERFEELDASKHPFDHIHNAQVMQYSRRDPSTGEVHRRFEWMRSICPWDTSLSRSDWQRIERRRFSNAELLAEVETYPRIIGAATPVAGTAF